MSTIYIKTGSEGPSYDPTRYTRITVDRADVKVTMHLGLSQWLKINDRKISVKGKTYDEACPILDEIFERHAGVSLQGAFKAHDEVIRRKIPRCVNGSRKHGPTRSMSGFPGESFEICTRCNHVVESFFDESAII